MFDSHRSRVYRRVLVAISIGMVSLLPVALAHASPSQQNRLSLGALEDALEATPDPTPPPSDPSGGDPGSDPLNDLLVTLDDLEENNVPVLVDEDVIIDGVVNGVLGAGSGCSLSFDGPSKASQTAVSGSVTYSCNNDKEVIAAEATIQIKAGGGWRRLAPPTATFDSNDDSVTDDASGTCKFGKRKYRVKGEGAHGKIGDTELKGKGGFSSVATITCNAPPVSSPPRI